MPATKTSYITCPLCEALCGLEVVTQGSEVFPSRVIARTYLATGNAALNGVAVKVEKKKRRETLAVSLRLYKLIG